MRNGTRSALCAALFLSAGSVHAQNQLTTVRLATGLTNPVFVTAPPGDFNRLFIVEQRGSGGVANQARIKILNLATNTVNATPFLTIGPVATESEQGLLGLAFDPNYASNGRFFVKYTSAPGTNVVARYTVSSNPDVASPTGTIILTQTQPFSNHNGGWIGFGPDGYLYVALGDGGSGGDPNGNGQSLTTLLGKILRLDVSGSTYSIPPSNPFFGSTSARQEIWAYGLRNPWRPSFDRATGDLWIADVGQDNWEEVNVQPAGTTAALNYGWRCYEGNSAFNTSGCAAASTMVFPVHTYSHATGCSITGGFVYRGCAMPALRGTYFFADYCSNRIWSFALVLESVQQFTERTSELARAGQTINSVTSFGEDAAGEMYIVDGGGEVYKIIPRCPANCDASTVTPVLNANDFQCFLNEFATADCYANCDRSNVPPILNANDFQCFLNAFAGGCS